MAILVQMLIFRDKTQKPRAISQLHTEHITECYCDSETVLGFSTKTPKHKVKFQYRVIPQLLPVVANYHSPVNSCIN